MKEYSTKDIANIVGIATPTVRKYAQTLEKAGYTFIKNDQGFRIFTDKDIQIFERMKEMSNDTGMPVDRIASMLVNEQKNEVSDTIRIESEVATPLENELKIIDESDIGRIDRQYEALLKETQKQEKVTLETAATTEDKTTEDKRTKKRGWLSRIFGK
jgi:DNA-binding transcriptional MerR regulator